MARKKRFYRLHSSHHVMLRGVGGQNIFIDDKDRVRFCLLLQAASEKYAFHIQAFCFMNNHIHLVLEPKERPLQDGVHSFSFRYAQYFNRRHERKGYLFQGRFRSICVQDGLYFKRLVRYIHLNPLHAELVRDPKDYHWSSHRAYLGLDNYVWLSKEKVLSNFGRTNNKEAINSLINFIYEKVDIESEFTEIMQAFKEGVFEDKEDNNDNLEQVIKQPSALAIKQPVNFDCSLNDAIDFVCSHYRLSPLDLVSSSRKKGFVEARAILALIARKSASWNFEDLAIFLDRDSSSISRLASKAYSRKDLHQIADMFIQKIDV